MGSKIKGENPPSRPVTDTDPEGAALWSLATRDVRPARKSRAHISSENIEKENKIPKRSRTVFRRVEREERLAAPTHGAFGLPGLPACPATRGRRRKVFVIEARLDLHGYTRDRAHGVLVRFLEAAQTEGKRCVLVITGKGRNRVDGLEEGVLRRHVPEWLAMAPLRSIVLETRSAHPRDGGTGALYVRLRKNQ